MTDTHPCDACGGSGIGSGLRCPCHGAPSTCCPVCLGAGSFPDRMPVADALADAETLRGLIRETGCPSTRWFEFYGTDGLEARVSLLLLSISPQLFNESGKPIQTTGNHGRWTGSLAARAAFRAVPGLRGE